MLKRSRCVSSNHCWLIKVLKCAFFWHVEHLPHFVKIWKNKTILCVHDPKLKYVTIAKKKKINMFQFGPAQLLWFQQQPARTSPACHKTLRHKDMLQPCKQDFYTPRQNEIIFCHWDYSRQAFMLCLSPARVHIVFLYIQEKKNYNTITRGVNCRVSPTGLSGLGQGLFIIHVIYSPSKRAFVWREINSLLACSLNKQLLLSIHF